MAAPRDTAEILAVWREYQVGRGVPLRNRLVLHYLPMAGYNASVLKRRLPAGVEEADLRSAGVFGLMQAIAAYDLGAGTAFVTYANARVRGEMLEYLRQIDPAPRLMRTRSERGAAAIERLTGRLGRAPTDQELATALGVAIEDLGPYRQSVPTTEPLHRPWAATGGSGRETTAVHRSEDAQVVYRRVGKKAAGRLLDGREWNEMPTTAAEKAVG